MCAWYLRSADHSTAYADRHYRITTMQGQGKVRVHFLHGSTEVVSITGGSLRLNLVAWQEEIGWTML